MSYSIASMMIEKLYQQLQHHEQTKLNAAGLSDVKIHIDWFKAGYNLSWEVRLSGPADLQKKARELLSFSNEE